MTRIPHLLTLLAISGSFWGWVIAGHAVIAYRAMVVLTTNG